MMMFMARFGDYLKKTFDYYLFNVVVDFHSASVPAGQVRHCQILEVDIGRIIRKGTIRTSKLDFENVYYVEELQHFNLFSVSQICDKKNKVLFTNIDCLVLTEEFQLPDESQVVLRRSLKPFGCQVTILNTSDHLGKFEGKADEGYLVGYAPNSKAYRVLHQAMVLVLWERNSRYMPKSLLSFRTKYEAKAQLHDMVIVRDPADIDSAGGVNLLLEPVGKGNPAISTYVSGGLHSCTCSESTLPPINHWAQVRKHYTIFKSLLMVQGSTLIWHLHIFPLMMRIFKCYFTNFSTLLWKLIQFLQTGQNDFEEQEDTIGNSCSNKASGCTGTQQRRALIIDEEIHYRWMSTSGQKANFMAVQEATIVATFITEAEYVVNTAASCISFLLDALFLLVAMDYADGSVFMLVGILLLVDSFLLIGFVYAVNTSIYAAELFDIAGWLVSATSHLVSAGSLQSCWYALTHDPPVVFDSLVKQFWATAVVRPNAAGSHDLVATIDGREVVVTESLIRTQLQFDDANAF
ncbi:hypothetical protein Tco_0530798 [Tanacetum coccineum]